ncbi:MAG TPA: hypothetical protein VJ810_13850 [Blastocatellia bacterium]|nr:hypothetical protein [Blastocatellia bacterium]
MAEAQLTLQKALSERSFEIEKDRIDRELRGLKNAYDQRLITVQDYYRDRLACSAAVARSEVRSPPACHIQ